MRSIKSLLYLLLDRYDETHKGLCMQALMLTSAGSNTISNDEYWKLIDYLHSQRPTLFPLKNVKFVHLPWLFNGSTREDWWWPPGNNKVRLEFLLHLIDKQDEK